MIYCFFFFRENDILLLVNFDKIRIYIILLRIIEKQSSHVCSPADPHV